MGDNIKKNLREIGCDWILLYLGNIQWRSICRWWIIQFHKQGISRPAEWK